jgi:hypothetical protein
MEEPQGTTPSSPTQAARQQWENAGARRRRWLGTPALVIVSLAAGAAGMWVVARRGAATPAAPSTAAPADEHAGHQAAPEAASATDAGSGKGVYISPAKQQLIGVRTAEVVHQALDRRFAPSA